jgi:hypothetical protein
MNQSNKTPSINWTDIWHRATQDELGIAIEFEHNGQNAHYQLERHRPPGLDDYTLCRTPDENLIYIVKPGVTLD